jgi:hypothetical protein
VDSTANSRTDPNFVRFNEAGDMQRLVPILAVDQRSHCDRGRDENCHKAIEHAFDSTTEMGG